jgi:flagellar basal-body rod modification protein FlgD
MSVSYVSSTAAGTASTTASTNSDRMNDLSMSDFIKMMVAELENQDPTNPMSNTEMLSQINQIRQVTSNDKLSSSIEALTLGQSLTTASSLIGKTITGTNSLGNEITGTVDKVMIENGKPKLYSGSNIVDLTAVSSVVNTPAAV